MAREKDFSDAQRMVLRSERCERVDIASRLIFHDRQTCQVRSVVGRRTGMHARLRAFLRCFVRIRVLPARKRKYPRACTRCPVVYVRANSHYLRTVTGLVLVREISRMTVVSFV